MTAVNQWLSYNWAGNSMISYSVNPLKVKIQQQQTSTKPWHILFVTENIWLKTLVLVFYKKGITLTALGWLYIVIIY